MRNRRLKFTGVVLIVFVWLVILFTPILFREDIYRPIKTSIMVQLQTLVPLLLLFLINRFLLVPKLLFRGKQMLFILSVFGVIILFTAGSFVYDKKY